MEVQNLGNPKQTLQQLLMAKYKEALGVMLSAKKLRREPGICHQLLSSTLTSIETFLKFPNLLCLAAGNSNKLIKTNTRVKARKTPKP